MTPRKFPLSALKTTLFAAALGVTAVGFAGDESGHRPHRDPAERMARQLSLDETQKAGVSAIFERNRPAHQALMQRFKAHHTAMRELKPGSPDYSTRAQALADEAGSLARDRVLQRTQLNAELATVLTPAQLQKLGEREPHGGRWEGRGRDGKGPGPRPEARS